MFAFVFVALIALIWLQLRLQFSSARLGSAQRLRLWIAFNLFWTSVCSTLTCQVRRRRRRCYKSNSIKSLSACHVRSLGPNYPTDLPVKRNTFSATALPCPASGLRRGAIDHTNDYYLSVVQANELSKREGERERGRGGERQRLMI